MLWKRRQGHPHAWKEKISVRFYRMLNRLQCRWALWMDARINRLPLKLKLFILVSFSLLMISASAFIAFSAVTGGNNLFIDTKPRLPPLDLHKNLPRPGLPKPVKARISRYRSYLDSLARTEIGKKTLDSILKARPGLLDSIREIEHIYQLPTTNQ